jgi:hypothetical protein
LPGAPLSTLPRLKPYKTYPLGYSNRPALTARAAPSPRRSGRRAPAG